MHVVQGSSMSKSRTLVGLVFTAFFFSSLGYSVVADRIAGDLNSTLKIPVKGNVHHLARAEYDLGRADGSRLIQGVSLAFRPSPAQQKDLDLFIAQLSDRSSP